MIYDCFPFFNELDILEIRLNELNNIVDKFVITESRLTHSGKEKPLYYKENEKRFEKFSDKIIHIIPDISDPELDAWARERTQRDALKNGLVNCKDDDIICISDVDEIPKSERLAEYSIKNNLVCLEFKSYYFYLNYKDNEIWKWFKILPYSMMKDMTPCQIRYTEAQKYILNSGWHFSFLGDIDSIIKKIESTAHTEYDTDFYKDKNKIKEKIENGNDIFGREHLKYTSVDIDYTYPRFILENLDRFKDKGYIKGYEKKDHVTRVIEEVDGFFSIEDIDTYRNLARKIKNGTIIEIGSYLGKSILSIADICKENNNKIYCVDTWKGSPEHQDGEPYSLCPVDKLFDTFMNNVKSLGFEDIITPIRMTSSKASEEFFQDRIAADLIFIDGEHSYASVKEDIESWNRNLKKDGILCGHDIVWPEIKKALEDTNTNHRAEYGLWISDMNEKTQITATISTKDRYFDTLPLCIESIINQTHKPKKLIIFDDGEQKDLREEPLYQNIFEHLYRADIDWQFVFGDRIGQVANHQKAIELAETEWIWRIDDDEVAEPDVLEKLIKNIKDDVGAIGGLVLDPKGEIQNLPDNINHNKIEEVATAPNIQWFKHEGVKEVDHLYSSFLFRKKAAEHGYCTELSPVGHREESIFLYEMKRGGWSILVDPSAITWHYRSPKGGIRSYEDENCWKHDEEIFKQKMEIWGKNLDKEKIIVLDSGMGDHIAFSSILPELLEKYPNLYLAVCYPEVFKDFDVRLISIKEADMILGKETEKQNIYQWMMEHNWDKHIIEAYREMHL